jgi:hypothetical protein
MTTPVTIRIRQQGIVRPVGYQATQWAVTVPVSDPISDPPLATDPLSFAPLFVIRTVEGHENLERVASVGDLYVLPVAELDRFDVVGNMAGELFDTAQPGDTLRITSERPYWTDGVAPYLDQDFTVLTPVVVATYSGTTAGANTTISVSGYRFVDADRNRWFKLSGSASNDGWYQILSGAGSVVKVNRAFTGVDGGTIQFFHLQLDPGGPGVEPRYFPTREQNLRWELRRSAVALVSNGTGGRTLRGSSEELVRSVRYTAVLPSMSDANNLFLVSRQQVAELQRAAEVDDTAFSALLTYTAGP